MQKDSHSKTLEPLNKSVSSQEDSHTHEAQVAPVQVAPVSDIQNEKGLSEGENHEQIVASHYPYFYEF